ncbi:Retinol dehydrogenase 7-like [Homarus americanus]|uniref:Retinol dehydrogenase 7-like n=1 Tax=Homarus americanus TaxID=6706 RepID=A0A8J5MUE6_HOMAM|nr:Retinol dehydrogenase 7-like [Homarus americanus]
MWWMVGVGLVGLFLAAQAWRARTCHEVEISGHRRVVVITGCDSGIGYSVAMSARAWGWTVVATCLSPDGEGAAHLREAGVHIVIVDLTQTHTLAHLLHTIQRLKMNNQEVWCVVNNAGLLTYASCEWQTSEMVERQVAVNLTGVIQVTKALLPTLRRNKGRVVMVSSPAGQVGTPTMSVYSATKWGVEGFTQAIRRELASTGVSVVLVRPCRHLYWKAMSKIYEIADLQQPSTSAATETGWDICVLYQNMSSEELICPAQLNKCASFGISLPKIQIHGTTLRHLSLIPESKNDQHRLVKLSAGDLIAQEAKYHVQCLVSLYSKARQAKVQTIPQGVALAELVSYNENAHTDTEAVRVFKLADLTSMYTTRLEQLGTTHKEGRNVFLVFNEGVRPALRKAYDHDADNDAIHLARAASIVRREMFKMESSFTGTFDSQCQGSSVPNSLMALKSRTKHQLSSVKTDCSLFSSLYISCQTWDGDFDEFFAHENQACPPSLSSMGKLRLGTNSDLVYCLAELIPPPTRYSTTTAVPEPSVDKIDSPTTDTVILDGAAIVNMMKPGISCTFSEHSTQIFLPYINSQLQPTNRVDLVWDEYIPGSLKTYTRSNRGKGSRRPVKSSIALSRNWQEFLRNDDNKIGLFSFLSKQVCGECWSKFMLREMIEGAGEETLRDYGEAMKEAEQVFHEAYGNVNQVQGLRDDRLLECFRSAIMSKRPLATYSAAPLLVRVALNLLQLLPTAWVDFLCAIDFHYIVLSLAKNS